MSTSSVTALATDGLSVRSSASWSIASTLRVLEHHVVDRRILVDLPAQHDVDAVARQHEAGDAVDIVDPDGHGLVAFADHRRQRRALALPGDLRGEHRLVGLDRGEHDALAVRQHLLDRPEARPAAARPPATASRAAPTPTVRCRSAAGGWPPRGSASATGCVFWASRLRRRASACELSQDCATNTASRPNTAATAIMMMVLLRTGYIPDVVSAISQIGRGQYRSADSIESVNSYRCSGAMLKFD